MQQAQDFLDESKALHDLVQPLGGSELERATGFKEWTIDDIVRHLHVWNTAALLSLTDEAGFDKFIQVALKAVASGSMRSFETEYMAGVAGAELMGTWQETFDKTAAAFAQAEPSARVKWAGPSMSARSSITARLMETWAHGQAVYDALGLERKNGERIKNIAVLGVNTYGWTFGVNGREAPEPRPYVELTPPAGCDPTPWTFGDASETECVRGDATEFCQVVTQTRNIADTSLAVTGPNATEWMAIAQCFAGPPETPPAPGARKRRGS